MDIVFVGEAEKEIFSGIRLDGQAESNRGGNCDYAGCCYQENDARQVSGRKLSISLRGGVIRKIRGF